MRLTTLFALLLTAGCSGADSEESAGGATSTGSQLPPENYAATDACTTLPQSGCPSEHTCQVASNAGETTCVKAGDTPLAGACLGSSDCGLGLFCGYGICRSYCEAADDCEGDVVDCLQIVDGNGDEITGQKYCTTPCNPADPANAGGRAGLLSCPTDWGCYAANEGTPSGTTDCFLAGSQSVGEECTNDCAPGLVCLNSGDSQACASFCLVGEGSCNCQSFAEPYHAAIDGTVVEVGFCQ